MNVVDGVDLYFATFAKSMAGIGAFVAGDEDIIKYLRFSLRSQIYAKSLPMPMVIGSLKRLDMIRTRPEFREKLWVIVHALQKGLRDAGFDIGTTQSPVTPVLFSGDIPEATQLTFDLRENYNIFCSIVSYPVVPKGVLMLRLIPTAVHTLEDVSYTIKAFGEIREKLAAGKYNSGVMADITGV
jgi:glycine C-acetyltransferase